MGHDMMQGFDRIRELANTLASAIEKLEGDDKIRALNMARRALHEVSPFRDEPVDLVEWVPADSVAGNDYNPNSVAPPEMRLLEKSIETDGFTMPIVSWVQEDGNRETIDGFHRGEVSRRSGATRERLCGYAPVTTINAGRADRTDRMAATIRHNRARGQHAIQSMSEIITELVRRRWSDDKIACELGMEADEVLRLKQITGLADLFAERSFSQAWEIDEEKLCRT
jgi:ParB-like chromosome segregation protein Spo0J